MRSHPVIQKALQAAGLDGNIASTRDLSGGCIHEVVEVSLPAGDRVVAKINRAAALPLFEEEAHGLKALGAVQTVLVPQPLAALAHEGKAVLLMTAIEHGRASESAWRRFGEELAALHTVNVGSRYGFEINNHLGSTYQPNDWCDDWVEFNAAHRLGFQLTTACNRNLLNASETRSIQGVIDHLDRFIPRRPKPALLHGDLWSGNALPAQDNRIAVIDPACYIGDGWADIAMMRLFGGFPRACLNAYVAAMGDHDNIEDRIIVYQIYHVLNHVNIFGRGYIGQVMDLAQQLRT